MNRVLSQLFMTLIFSLTFEVSASPLSQCQNASKSSVAQCKAAEGALAAKDAARSASPGGGNINQNAGRLAADAAAQKGDVGQALAQCQQAKQQCESQCDAAKAQAAASQQYRPQVGPISSTKASQCTAPLQAEIAKLQQAMGNLGGDQQAAQDTGNQSGSGMPPITPPQSQPKEEKKSDEQKAAEICGTENGVRYSDCNDQYISKCAANMSDAGCGTFIDRYCNSSAASGASSSPWANNPSTSGYSPSTNSGTGLGIQSATVSYVVDKKGEGLGSDFCSKVISARFCAASGRSGCPSCTGTTITAEQLKRAQSSCPSDPMFLSPEVLAKIKGEPESTPVTAVSPEVGTGSDAPRDTAVSGTSGASGGSGSFAPNYGAASAKGGASDIAMGAVSEGSSNGMSTASYGGGGGGGNYDPSSEGDARGPASAMGFNGKKPMPAARVEGMAADVSNQYGPSLFSISSGTYKNLCSRGKLLHCRAN